MVNLEYKGFRASVIYDEDDGIYHGKFEVINHLVMFESQTPETVLQEFHDAVDDYIEFCKRYNVHNSL